MFKIVHAREEGNNDFCYIFPRFFTKKIIFLCVQDQVGEVLRKSGISVLTTSLCNIAAFLAAALIPIPAMRAFCCQVLQGLYK